LNSRSHQPVLRTLTDRFQLDTIHQQILTKLTSNQGEQPLYVLANQPLNKNEHNTFFIQITLRQPIVDEKFSFDIIYQSDESKRTNELTGPIFNEEISRLQSEFDEKFERIFQLKGKYNMTKKHIHFARSTLSNLIGGISYFTGKIEDFLMKQTNKHLFLQVNHWSQKPIKKLRIYIFQRVYTRLYHRVHFFLEVSSGMKAFTIF